jgi:hypothetical protein
MLGRSTVLFWIGADALVLFDFLQKEQSFDARV